MRPQPQMITEAVAKLCKVVSGTQALIAVAATPAAAPAAVPNPEPMLQSPSTEQQNMLQYARSPPPPPGGDDPDPEDYSDEWYEVQEEDEEEDWFEEDPEARDEFYQEADAPAPPPLLVPRVPLG